MPMGHYFDIKTAFGTAGADAPHLLELLMRMLLASVLAAFVAYRVWRKLMPSTSPVSPQGAQTQTLIAAAGALMVVVIGDNVARAFGLVGLGSFIRFRSGITDTRDAAIMFVMIGIGMACGLGLPIMAIAGTLFVSVLLMIFDATAHRRARRTLVSISAEDPPAIWPMVSRLFRNIRVVELASTRPELGKDSGKLLVELDLQSNMDAAGIRQLLESNNVPGITRVAIVE